MITRPSVVDYMVLLSCASCLRDTMGQRCLHSLLRSLADTRRREEGMDGYHEGTHC